MATGIPSFQATLESLFSAFEPTLPSQYYAEDIVLATNRTPQCLGVVERTHQDVDSHTPHPQADYPEAEIKRGSHVPHSAFQTFLRDGVPPKDTILVRWQGIIPVELVNVKNVALVDRSLLVGDVVKRNAQSTMSGTVTNASISCALASVGQTTLELCKGTSSPRDIMQNRQILRDVPGAELRHARKYMEGSVIVYNGWIGRVEFVERDIVIRLSNNSVVVVADPSEVSLAAAFGSEEPEVGEQVRTKKGNLRRGRWVYGSFDANIEPVGQVVEMPTVSLEVSWLFQRLGSTSPEPPDELDVDVLNSGEIDVYDRTRVPKPPSTSANNCAPRGTALDLAVGDCVRFRDIAGAAMKYDGTHTTSAGHLTGLLRRVPRAETLGYDLNTFGVLATHTEVTVLWQDLTTTTQAATSLIPDLNIDDEDEVWPGEIVITAEPKADDHPAWSFIPAKVGVVQSVKSADRIAKIRWWPQASVQYYRDVDAPPGSLDEPTLMPDASLGELSEAVEDVSLYDIKAAIGLNKRLGDLVLIKSVASNNPSGNLVDTNLDWFGEVVQLGLDGKVSVRLGALDDVRDVRTSPEDLLLVHGSDMDDTLDGEGDDESELDDESDDFTGHEWEDAMDIMSFENTEAIDYVVDYLGNGGERMDVDGDEDAWSTASESDDTDDESNADTPLTEPKSSVTNTPPRKTESTEHPAAEPMEASDSLHPPPPMESLGLLDRPDAPPSFSILDSIPPTSHHFYNSRHSSSTTGLRRINKEHKILRTSLPEGVYVRTWESRLDLLRVLFIGPLDTPYMYAPFVMDIHLSPEFPTSPPDVFFHSWTNGTGPVNPNLYEDGKVCLSLLGTWHAGEKTESWDPEKSTVLQVLVSILGLVLVKEPYFNEAGYEVRVGSEDAKIPSALYSERTYLRSRAFITHALRYPVEGLADEIWWVYQTKGEGTPSLLDRAIAVAHRTISLSEGTQPTNFSRDGVYTVSAGAVVKLRQQIQDLEACRAGN